MDIDSLGVQELATLSEHINAEIAGRVAPTRASATCRCKSTRGPAEKCDGTAVLQLKNCGLDQLQDLRQQVQANLRTKLVQCSKQEYASHVELLAQPGGGLTRILHRGAFCEQQIGIPGGAAFFSFVDSCFVAQDGANIGLNDGFFVAGYAEEHHGMLMDIEQGDLMSLSLVYPPHGMDDEQNTKWNRMMHSSEPTSTDKVEALVGHTYLLRHTVPDETDVVVGFQVVQEDVNGMTLAYRILQRRY